MLLTLLKKFKPSLFKNNIIIFILSIMKNVRFDLNKNQEYSTYSLSEYDRIPYASLYHGKITQEEWNGIFKKLNKFKLTEMIVHHDSLKNIRLHDY